MLASLALALFKPTSLVPPLSTYCRRLETRSERRRVATKAEDDGKDEVPPRFRLGDKDARENFVSTATSTRSHF